MPNWCDNNLIIKGDVNSIKKFINDNIGPRAIFNDEKNDFTKLLTSENINNNFIYFIQPIQFNQFCFNALVPIPKEVIQRGYDAQIPYDTSLDVIYGKYEGDQNKLDGYHWCISNWGTKWDIACDRILEKDFIEDDYNEYSLVFYTAWGPPLEWFTTICKLYNNLTITLEYFEPGMMLGGIAEWVGETNYFNNTYYDEDTLRQRFGPFEWEEE